MSSQRNSQRRSQSSTRVQLARDLHDSIAQDLVAIGFKLDLFIADLPSEFRAPARSIRLQVTEATSRVRKELYALREHADNQKQKLAESASPLALKVTGEFESLDTTAKRIISELVNNSALYSKGRTIEVQISRTKITVKDDGLGMFGIGELVDEIGGRMHIDSNGHGTKVEIALP